jgi:lipopolysaccharide transport system permease protein
MGVGWAVLQPFLTMLIFTVIFARIVPMPSHGIPYPLFVFSALVPWLYFSQAVSRTGSGLVMNANLISKVYFPRLIIPLAAATTPLADLLLGLGLLLGILAWYQFMPPPEIVLLPAFSLMAFVAALAFGLWLSALNVRYRDVGHIIPFLVQIGMFASPVIYPVSLVPAQWQGVYALNPMVAVIEGYRWCLLGAPAPDFATMVTGTLSILVFLVGGLMYFKSTERTFADLI